VWFLFSDVSARLGARTQADFSANEQSAQQGNAIELHALVTDTATERAALDTSVDTDVVGIANQIEAAGKAAGTQTTIGSASVVGPAGVQSGVNELEFVVQSTGSFQEVWRAAQLYQTLPLPSTVSELDLEEIPDGGKTVLWQLTADIDVLTSAQISS
jgi:hypothetical protein